MVEKGAVRDVIEQVMKVQGTWIDDDTQLFKWESGRIESKSENNFPVCIKSCKLYI